jgi:LPS export ABC transporter protein LptC
MTNANKILAVVFCLVAVTGLSACSGGTNQQLQAQKDKANRKPIEGNLVFNNFTLDQADERGLPLWQVKAKQASYTQNKKRAKVEKPTGKLFQDGQLVLEVSADRGEVWEDGKQVFLQGQIVAKDPRNGTVMRGQQLEWRPQEDVLIVRQQITGTHAKIQATAREARYFTRPQQMELQGQIVAVSADPPLQLRTEQLIWQMPQQQVIGNSPIQIDRYQGKTITDRVAGNSGAVNLKTKTVTLKQNVQLKSINPPLDIVGDSAIWNLNAETVVSDSPVRIWHPQEELTATGNSASIDLRQKIAVLAGNVRAIEHRNRGTLATDRLRWNIATGQIQADGKVIYQQAKPPLKLTGASGLGKLQNQTFVVRGSGSSRVVTEIIPESGSIQTR